MCCVGFCFCNDFLGFFLGICQELVAFVLQTSVKFLSFCQFLLQFCFFRRNFFKFFFVLLANVVGSCKCRFKFQFFVRNVLLGKIYDVLAQAEFCGYCQRVRTARYAHNQPVSRCKSFYIKFHRCVFHAFSVQRILFKFSVVRRYNSFCTAFTQKFSYGNRKRSAFVGFGSCADLVNQNKIAATAHIENIPQICNVSGKRGQILLYALFVADVAKDIVEERYDAVVGTRNEHSAHCHNRHKSDCFKRCGFAAGVWTCDHYNVVIAAEFYGNRHNFGFVQQRMTRLFDIDDAFVVQNRQSAFVVKSVFNFAENHVDVANRVLRGNDFG